MCAYKKEDHSHYGRLSNRNAGILNCKCQVTNNCAKSTQGRQLLQQSQSSKQSEGEGETLNFSNTKKRRQLLQHRQFIRFLQGRDKVMVSAVIHNYVTFAPRGDNSCSTVISVNIPKGEGESEVSHPQNRFNNETSNSHYILVYPYEQQVKGM